MAEVRAGNGYQADLHEIRLTPQGTAWIDVFDPIHMNLSSVHGAADGILTDSVVQEIDVKTGLVMWEWHALGHIPLGESNNPVSASGYPWDYVHINSVDPGSAGDVLLSARNTWTLYDVDIHSGGFIWRLGGRHSSFKLGPGTRFYWQHDAEFQPGGLISVFDNGSDPPKEKQSRGLLLAPDTANHTVTLVKQFVNPTKTLLAESQGNTAQPARRKLAAGLRQTAELHRVRRLRPRPARRDARQERAGLQDLSRLRGAASRRLRRRWPRSPDGAGAGHGRGELERRHRRRLLARARGLLPERARARSPPLRRPASRPRSRCHTAGPYVAVQALDASGAVIGVSRRSKSDGLDQRRRGASTAPRARAALACSCPTVAFVSCRVCERRRPRASAARVAVEK